MINLRYHIVSIVAVFLALGIGVVMGSTVIDRVTVDTLNARVNSVERRVREAETENQRINGQLQTVRDFADQARDQITRSHLTTVPVLVMAVQGIDRKPVDALREALVTSEATVAGTLWFTPKMRLSNDGDTKALAAAAGLALEHPERPDADGVRTMAISRLVAGLAGTGEPNLLPSLSGAGFLAYEAAPTQTGSPESGLAALPLPGMRVVLVSGAGASVSDDVVAVPLARVLAQSSTRLVAAEAGQDTPGGRGVFVGLLRRDGDISPRISTVDDLESPMGQAATVLALQELAGPRTGHFGVGPGAERLLPASQS
ncbi:MAG TPA: copper transporter [Acidimicrobiales bacterium]|nr:copper transporter [Acidimicrobiales bacterium]